LKNRKEQVTFVHHITTRPQPCSGKREYAKELARQTGASRVVNQMFDNGINQITDWQNIRSKEGKGSR
jgi:hypothetical protein